MARRQLYVAAGFASTALLLQGCGNAGSPVPPTAPAVTSAPADAPAPLEFSLSGAVIDTAYRPLGGARVEVKDGPRIGTVATTDETGRFSMPGTFTSAITVTASKEGYLSETRVLPPASPPGFGPPPSEGRRFESYFHLEPLGSFPSVAGTYSLTLTADRVCTNLPDDARTRTYTATIVPVAPGARTAFRVTLNDARFFSTYNRALIATAGNFAGFSVCISDPSQSYCTPGIVEQTGETTYLAIEGAAEGTFEESGMTARFAGYFQYCPVERPLIGNQYECPASAVVQCDAENHRLTLVRR